MHNLSAGIKNEVQKIFLKKKTSFLLLSVILITTITAVLIALFQNKTGIFAFSIADFPTITLGIFTNFLLPLYIFSLAADVFAGEEGNNTLKIALTKPISRFKVFLSKNIALAIFISSCLALAFVSAILTGFFVNPAGNFGDIFKVLLAYTVALLPMFAVSIFAAFIAQFFKAGSSALTACIFIYLGAKALPFIPLFTAKIARAVLFTYTDWHTLWLGSSLGDVKLVTVFLLLLSYSIIFFTAGYYFFDKKEL